MLQYDFQDSVGYWLHLASQAFTRALAEELVPHGITYRQCQVLAFLILEKRPLSQIELAERISVEPPTLVGILDRMERDGWLRRQACTSDRRKKLICLTEEAGPVWAQIAECALRVRARAISGLTEAQVESLKEMLRTVKHNLSENLAQEVA